MRVADRSENVARSAAGPLASMTRCVPEKMTCQQQSQCVRAAMPHNRDALTIDGTVCKVGGWCPMFLDSRGARLDPRLQHLESF